MRKNASLPGGRRERWRVAVLGATGAVGQTFVRLLAGHPWFELAEVAASERSAGRMYADSVRWLEGELPAETAEKTVRLCHPDEVTAPIVFSALDSAAAGELEPAFAAAGRMVLTNARNFRMDDDVPLVIPEVNGTQLELLAAQRRRRGWSGGIVTNANCAATVAALALAPLHEKYGLRRAFLTTLQALSGAGYPGVASLDILGNAIPYISGEEPKIEVELRKLLGTHSQESAVLADFVVSAHANRVHVRHGHMVCISAEFAEVPTVDAAQRTISEWRGDPRCASLPSAPQFPVEIAAEADRPQPAKDADKGDGMVVTVGRLREDPLFHLRMVALGHNTVRGAAGGSVLNAELLASTGQLPQGE